MERKLNRKSVCQLCDKEFKSKKILNGHLRIVHNCEPVLQRQHKIRCPNAECNFICRTHAMLRSHVGSHIKLAEGEVHTFSNIEEFNEWKSNEERDSLSHFVRRTSKVKLKCTTKLYYFCHRSGEYNSSGKGIRSLKSQGSFKIGSTCPASLEVYVNSNRVLAKYYKTHYGHTTNLLDLEKQHLQKKERELIAAKLQAGESFDCILNEIRNSASTEESLNRIHLLSRKDLHNIVRDFKIHYSSESSTRGQNKTLKSLKYLVKKSGTDISDIRKNHKASLTIPDSYITKSDDDYWIVRSQCDESQEYIVYRQGEEKCKNCQLFCNECRICIHYYTCTCENYVVLCKMCKHVHKIASLENTASQTEEEEDFDDKSVITILQTLADQENVQPETEGNTQVGKQKLVEELERAMLMVKCAEFSKDALEQLIGEAKNLTSRIVHLGYWEISLPGGIKND